MPFYNRQMPSVRYLGKVRYVTRKTYIIPRTLRVGFTHVAARQDAGVRAEMLGLSALVCVMSEERGRSQLKSVAVTNRYRLTLD